jgi:hypothetical protein
LGDGWLGFIVVDLPPAPQNQTLPFHLEPFTYLLTLEPFAYNTLFEGEKRLLRDTNSCSLKITN